MSKNYSWACAYCAHLDTTRRKWDDKHYCYLVGCNERKGGFVCGWCKEDKELKLQGCSGFKLPDQIKTEPQHKAPATATPPKQTPPAQPEAVQLSIFDLFDI